MSHLTTLCERVERRLRMYGGKEEEAAKSPIFRQEVRNLQEYQNEWDDFTEAEQVRADRLYGLFAHLCKEGR